LRGLDCNEGPIGGIGGRRRGEAEGSLVPLRGEMKCFSTGP
jgi:hypothetical protein